MSPRAVPDPRPALVLGAAGWALSLMAVAAGVFVGGVWIASRIWPEVKS